MVVLAEIKKYPENKKFFTDDEWNNIDTFFNSCITNKNFPVFVDFGIHYPSANVVADAVRRAGGTDCHGEKKSNRKIGKGYGNMNVNKNIFKKWCT